MRRRLPHFALAAVLVVALTGARQRAVRGPAGSSPTFNNEVVRILQDHCQTCHHPGDIAPFSLLTYKDAKLHSADMKYMTQTRQMPPWKPATSCSTFAEARVLTTEQIETIGKWVDAGAPEGNAADLPAPVHFSGEWALGEPDLVLSYPESYTPPTTADMYRCFTIPSGAIADQYVSAIDVIPGDRQTVHHVIAYLDLGNESVTLDEKDPGPGYTSFGGPGFSNLSSLGGWAPGARPVMLPDGIAMELPAASRIVLQVHYHPHGAAAVPDRTKIGIYFAKQKPKQILRTLPLINTSFTIPPGDDHYKVTAGFPIATPYATHVWVIAPHMHLLGREANVEATLPDGTKRCMINISDWDFNWQGLYRYKDAIALPAGTRLSMTSYYDNSAGNLRNPNVPPKPVSWGEQTTDEMCIAFVGFTIDAENLAQGQTVETSWVHLNDR